MAGYPADNPRPAGTMFPRPSAKALARLLDDASQFPPGNMELEPAWEAHKRWRAHEHAALVGRFLLPARRAKQLASLIGFEDEVEIGVVVGSEQPADLAELLDGAGRVTSLELRADPAHAAGWGALAPEAGIFLEGVAVQDVAQGRRTDQRLGAKLRCGGPSADAFPTCEEVASFIASCVELDVPFKATAGLHEPLRHWDPALGVHHHGFMNLWSATALAAAGATDALAGCLNADSLDQLPALDRAELERARRWFTAFGTCSIAEPLAGLQELQLLDS